MVELHEAESLYTALKRAFGPAVLDLRYSAISEGIRGPEREDALREVAAILSELTGWEVRLAGPERLLLQGAAGHAEAKIPPDAYTYGAELPGGLIELSRAFNTAAAALGLPQRAVIFFSLDEVGGLWIAPTEALEPWFEAVSERYEVGVPEQLALYVHSEQPVHRAGIR